MALLIFEHAPRDNAARLGQILRDRGHRLRVLKLYDADPPPPDLDDIDGIVSLGGPMNVDEGQQFDWVAQEIALIRAAHESALPVTGICLGAQLIAAALGGEVQTMPVPEHGWHPVRLTPAGTIDPILAGIPWDTMQFQVHGQQVSKLPPAATNLAGSRLCEIQAFKVGLRTYAFQYHFEWGREEINHIIEKAIAPADAHVEPIRAQIESFYGLYRHLGDRLAANLADLLFPLDRRLQHTKGPVANFHASVS